MLTESQLKDSLARAARQHQKLRSKFARFAALVETYPQDPDAIGSISVHSALEADFLEVDFVGRRLRFSFSTLFPSTAAGAAVGSVECSLLPRRSDRSSVHIGSFCFSQEGEPDMRPPPGCGPLHLDSPSAAVFLVLYYLQQSLSCQNA